MQNENIGLFKKNYKEFQDSDNKALNQMQGLLVNILLKTYLDFILFHEFCQEPNLPISTLCE